MIMATEGAHQGYRGQVHDTVSELDRQCILRQPGMRGEHSGQWAEGIGARSVCLHEYTQPEEDEAERGRHVVD